MTGTCGAERPDLAAQLAVLSAVLAEDGARPAPVSATASRIRARTDRDLLPRLEQVDGPTVVGLVGPNNAGKSSLFNSIVGAGRTISPAAPTGGFTRVLVGAVAPDVLAASRSLLERRFRVQIVRSVEVEQVTRADAAEDLLLVAVDGVPGDLVVIDAPDFDSIYDENRRAEEALLLTADLLIAVVTPHTYQNREVVRFLREAVVAGRPYVLVYNEAAERHLAVRHLEKLAGDLGVAPLASFYGLHDPAVARGAALIVRRLDSSAGRELAQEETLAGWLGDQANTDGLRRTARAAALRELRSDLASLQRQWEDAMAGPESLAQGLEAIVRGPAESASRALFPLTPFREALQAELDRRSVAHRMARAVPAAVGSVVREGYRSLQSMFGMESTATSSREAFLSSERTLLLGAEDGLRRRRLETLWERASALVHTQRKSVSPEAVEGDFHAARRPGLLGEFLRLHELAPVPFTDFRKECEAAIAVELEGRDDEAGLQWMYTGLRVLPPVATVAVMAMTGFAGDVGASVAYLVAEPVLDRAVGRQFVRRTHERWWRRRTLELIGLLGETLAPATFDELAKLREARSRESEAAESAMKVLDCWQHDKQGQQDQQERPDG